jgi:hypothetical protein
MNKTNEHEIEKEEKPPPQISRTPVIEISFPLCVLHGLAV